MTPEDREAIDRLGLLLDATFFDANHPAMLDWARVAMLVKVERTCGTCRHSVSITRWTGALGEFAVCNCSISPANGRQVADDDGCLKGWEPKEGADAPLR